MHSYTGIFTTKYCLRMQTLYQLSKPSSNLKPKLLNYLSTLKPPTTLKHSLNYKTLPQLSNTS